MSDEVENEAEGAPEAVSTGHSAPLIPAHDPLIGQTFVDKYAINKKLGEGGFGAVYAATQLVVDRPVAVKVLRPDRASDPRVRDMLVKRFQREAVATSKLTHPNTVRLFDFGETAEGELFLVLELLTGRELSDAIRDESPMHPARVARIARGMCTSLAEAHGQGIIHRDLKPANIFLCDFDGSADFVKVMDFGIARVQEVGQEQNLTQTGMTQGTPAYMAPEQAMAKEVTPSADLYSIGCMLYQMLTGVQVFEEESALAVSLAHVRDIPKTVVVPNCKPEVSEAWDDLIQLLLKKKPEQRPQTAREVSDMLQQLELVGDGLQPGSQVNVQALQQTMPRPAITDSDLMDSVETTGADGGTPAVGGKKGFPWAIAAALVLAVGGGGAWFALQGGQSTPAGAGLTTADPSSKVGAGDKAVAPGGTASAESAANNEKKAGAVAVPTPAAPAEATLKLETTPPGAQIFDSKGIPKCRTPCTVNSPPTAGVETWTAVKSGFTDTPIKVELFAGKETASTVALIAEAPAVVPAAPAAKKKKKKKKAPKAQAAPPPLPRAAPPKKPAKPKKPMLPGFRKTKKKKALPKLRR